MKKVVLTGGGSAGHVTPNMALISTLQDKQYEIHYVGSYDGIEKDLITPMNIPYYGISSGKLRRYLDIKNFTDPFKVLKGYLEARKILKKLKPNVLFSKGGFVTVPVVFAAKHLGIPIVIHESDMTPGLANRLSLPYAKKICVTFPETLNHLPKDKAVLTGTPIRKELFSGSRERALNALGLKSGRPVLLIIGGSLGSIRINETIRGALPELLKRYQVLHICGNNRTDASYNQTEGYIQLEYVKEALADIFSLADAVVSRAGANAICELLALKKPHLLIPLSANASRGDQILNAQSFANLGYSMVLPEENLNVTTLVQCLDELNHKKNSYTLAMAKSELSDSVAKVVNVIDSVAK